MKAEGVRRKIILMSQATPKESWKHSCIQPESGSVHSCGAASFAGVQTASPRRSKLAKQPQSKPSRRLPNRSRIPEQRLQ